MLWLCVIWWPWQLTGNKQRYIIIIFNIFLNYIKLTTEPEEDKIISFLDEEVVQWLVTWQDMKGHYAKINRKFIAHRSAKYCNVRHVSPLLPDHALFTYKGIPQPIRRWQRTFFLWRRRFCNFAHSGTFGDKRFQYGMSYDPKVTNESVPFWEKIQTYCKYWLYNSLEWCTQKYTLSHFVILKIYMNPLRQTDS